MYWCCMRTKVCVNPVFKRNMLHKCCDVEMKSEREKTIEKQNTEFDCFRTGVKMIILVG